MSTKNLTIDQGQTLRLTVEMQNPDESPMDLTSHTMALEVYSEGEPVTSVSVSGSGDGISTLRVTDETTAAWPLGRYTYRVRHDEPNGDKTYPVKGVIIVEGLDS